MDHHGNCPKCGSSWDAGDIFETLRRQDWCKNKSDDELRELVKTSYAPPYRFSRLIGVEIRGYYDGVAKWRCPDCGAEWDRFSKESADGKQRRVFR